MHEDLTSDGSVSVGDQKMLAAGATNAAFFSPSLALLPSFSTLTADIVINKRTQCN